MKTYPNIDYQQRPISYWDDRDVLASLLRDVVGTARRKLITDCWRKGRLEELCDHLLENTLSDAARKHLSRIHPTLMGGEYLPEFGSGETEIARLELESTTADVISIRARRECGLIRFRIVDEYNTEFLQERETGPAPLSLEELIRFIDGSRHPDLTTGLAVGYNDVNADCGCDREALRHFTKVRSGIYRQLEAHYEHVFSEWVEESL